MATTLGQLYSDSSKFTPRVIYDDPCSKQSPFICSLGVTRKREFSKCGSKLGRGAVTGWPSLLKPTSWLTSVLRRTNIFFPQRGQWSNLLTCVLPHNSFRVVPDFPWRARVTSTTSRVAATVQEAGIESESARFVVSFPFVGVSVRQPPPNQSDPAALLLPASPQTVSSRSSVIVVATGFQWYKVPLLWQPAVAHCARHARGPVFADAGDWVRGPDCAGENGSRRFGDARFQVRCAMRSSGVAAIYM